jgi:nitroreductase
MLEAIRTRRSIRKYEARAIEPAVVEQLEEGMLRAPSSRNHKPWHFVFVTDGALLEALSRAKATWGEFLAQAPLGVVVCGDPSVSDCWIEDGSIAATILMLQAADLGLGTCWIQIRDRDNADGRPAEQHIRELLGLPDGLSVLCMIAAGYPAEEKAPRERDSLSWAKIEQR